MEQGGDEQGSVISNMEESLSGCVKCVKGRAVCQAYRILQCASREARKV